MPVDCPTISKKDRLRAAEVIRDLRNRSRVPLPCPSPPPGRGDAGAAGATTSPLRGEVACARRAGEGVPTQRFALSAEANRPMTHFDSERPADTLAREALLDRVMGRARVFKPSERLRRSRKPAAGLALVAAATVTASSAPSASGT